MSTARQSAGVRLTDYEPTSADFRSEFVAGLRRRPRRLPCKFFYDGVGSELFDRICETPEYYPTRTELRILEEAANELAAFCGPRCRLVELGSGSSLKTRRVLDVLADPVAYVPIDISHQHLWTSAVRLSHEYPNLELLPVCADYGQDLELPVSIRHAERTVVFFPGSTIGNLEPLEAIEFLQRIASWCQPGDRLILGVDLVKPVEILQAAYNDASGVTAAFNLNLLARANRELGADFALEHWSHRATYNPTWQRIEMHLVSASRQRVRVGEDEFAFADGEAILTEYSHKFSLRGARELARAAGWSPRESWTDNRTWFGVLGFER